MAPDSLQQWVLRSKNHKSQPDSPPRPPPALAAMSLWWWDRSGESRLSSVSLKWLHCRHGALELLGCGCLCSSCQSRAQCAPSLGLDISSDEPRLHLCPTSGTVPPVEKHCFRAPKTSSCHLLANYDILALESKIEVQSHQKKHKRAFSLTALLTLLMINCN